MNARSRTAPDIGRSSNRGFIVAVVAIFLIGAAVVAVLASNRSTDSGATGIPTEGDVEVNAEVVVDGDALEQVQAPGITTPDNDPAIGLIAPTLTGTDFSGDEVTVAPDGTGKVIMFLAHWCSHCQAEVPRVAELIEAGELPEGVEVIAVSTAVDSGQGNYPPNDWLASETWLEPIIRDSVSADAYRAYGGGGFPYVVYLDGDNRVLTRSSGQLSPDQIVQLWDAVAAS